MALDTKVPKNRRMAWNGGVRPITGVDLIASERVRQMCDEGWTLTHDDAHRQAEMVAAACCYAGLARRQADGTIQSRARDIGPPSGWPWAYEWWKPTDDPTRNLVKAGALIAAEIDRLQRRRALATKVDAVDPAEGIVTE